MYPRSRILTALAALSGFVAVSAGAFGAHAAANAEAKTLLTTGAEYQLIHSLAVFATFLVAARPARVAGWLFLIGGGLFSGSLYLMALGEPRWLGAVTPLGGMMFLVGWLALAFAAFRQGHGVEDQG